MEGSHPAAPAEPGTLKTSLVATPGPVLARGRVLCRVAARVGVEVRGAREGQLGGGTGPRG